MLQPIARALGDLLRGFRGDHAVAPAAVEIGAADRPALADRAIQQRLRERRLVALVVAAAAVADTCRSPRRAESCAEIDGQIDHLRHRFRIFAVDVEDRDLQHLRDVGGVEARSPFAGRRREADLVVDDDVQRAADGVASESLRLSVSWMMPSPANAASPWTSSARPRSRAASPTRSCLARMRPSATGLTNSRWLGLKHSDRCTFCPPLVIQSRDVAQVILHVAAALLRRLARRRRTRGRSPGGSCP